MKLDRNGTIASTSLFAVAKMRGAGEIPSPLRVMQSEIGGTAACKHRQYCDNSSLGHQFYGMPRLSRFSPTHRVWQASRHHAKRLDTN